MLFHSIAIILFGDRAPFVSHCEPQDPDVLSTASLSNWHCAAPCHHACFITISSSGPMELASLLLQCDGPQMIPDRGGHPSPLSCVPAPPPTIPQPTSQHAYSQELVSRLSELNCPTLRFSFLTVNIKMG